MKEIGALLKWAVTTLVRKPLIGVLLLFVFWGSWGWLLLVDRILKQDAKDAVHAKEMKAATDETVSALKTTVEVQQNTIIRNTTLPQTSQRHETPDSP